MDTLWTLGFLREKKRMNSMVQYCACSNHELI